MVFSSLFFLYAFLPVCLICYGLSPSGYQSKTRTALKNVVLTLFSVLFYAWGEPTYVFMMLGSVLVNYLLGLGINKMQTAKKRGLSKFIFIIGLLFNIGLLVVFKYTGFIVENLNRIPGVELTVPQIALPIGISFYTFQILSYLIDLYWEKIKVQRNPLNLLLYISMFPQLIAGPIVRYSTVEAEIHTPDYRSCEKGHSRKPPLHHR